MAARAGRSASRDALEVRPVARRVGAGRENRGAVQYIIPVIEIGVILPRCGMDRQGTAQMTGRAGHLNDPAAQVLAVAFFAGDGRRYFPLRCDDPAAPILPHVFAHRHQRGPGNSGCRKPRAKRPRREAARRPPSILFYMTYSAPLIILTTVTGKARSRVYPAVDLMLVQIVSPVWQRPFR